MPSPDLRPLVDLTVFDEDAADIYTKSKAVLASYFPDWVEDDVQLAVVFLQAVAVEVADLAVMVNRLPGAILEGLLQLFSIVRSIGTPPTASVTFTLVDTAGHTIPAGTRVRWQSGSTVVDFTLDDDLVVDVGDDTGTGDVTGVTYTADANGVPAGTSLQVVSAVGIVSAVELATDVTGGSGAESDQTWMQRGIQTLARLVKTLVRPEHFTLAALDHTELGVYRATTLARTDDSGDPANGHVCVVVAGVDGALLTGGQKDDLLAILQGMASIELTAHVIDAEITAVDIDVTVARRAEASAAAAEADVRAALAGFVNPNTWPWNDTVRFFDLVALIEDVATVDHIDTFTTPNADVDLTGVGNLVTLGTVAVTVIDP